MSAVAAALSRHRRHVSSVVADNLVSSASNFLAAFLAVRVSSADGFADAGVALVLVRISIAVARAFSVEPMVASNPQATIVTREDVKALTRSSLLISAILSTISVAFMYGFGFRPSVALLALLTFGLAAMSWGEAVRSFSLLRRQYRPPFAFDVAWLVLLVAVTPLLLVVAGPAEVLLTWAATGALAGLVLLPWLRALPTRSAAREIGLRVRFGVSAETALDRTSNQLSVAVIAGSATASLATGLTAARTVLSPLNPMLFSAFNILMPISASASVAQRQRALRTIMLVGPLAVFTLAAVIVVLPTNLMVRVIGPTWSSARPVFIPMAMLFASAIVRQLAVAIARGSSIIRELRFKSYACSALTFAPCLLAPLAPDAALAITYAVTALSLGSAVFIAGSVGRLLDQQLRRTITRPQPS